MSWEIGNRCFVLGDDDSPIFGQSSPISPYYGHTDSYAVSLCCIATSTCEFDRNIIPEKKQASVGLAISRWFAFSSAPWHSTH